MTNTIQKRNLLRSSVTWTHWGQDKMAAISQTTLSNSFSWMKMLEFRLKFHWNLFHRVQLTIFQHWFRWWLGVIQVTSHYLKQWWLVHRRIYESLALNELRHINWQKSYVWFTTSAVNTHYQHDNIIHCISGKLWYLQHSCVGDTIVYH